MIAMIVDHEFRGQTPADFTEGQSFGLTGIG